MKAVLFALNAKYIHSNLAVYSLKASAGQWKDEVEIADLEKDYLELSGCLCRGAGGHRQ